MPTTCPPQSGMVLEDNIYYEYHSIQKRHLEARALCHSRGLELASIATEQEKINLQAIISKTWNLFLGGISGSWNICIQRTVIFSLDANDPTQDIHVDILNFNRSFCNELDKCHKLFKNRKGHGIDTSHFSGTFGYEKDILDYRLSNDRLLAQTVRANSPYVCQSKCLGKFKKNR